MAFSCGIPALWIVNDERTHEMVSAMRLPHIYEADLDNINGFHEFMDVADYNEKFMKYYKQMGDSYVKFLEKNGVEHAFKRNRD